MVCQLWSQFNIEFHWISLNLYMCRPPSCLTSQSPTCPSCLVSWRRKCLPPSSTVRSSATMTRRRSTRWGCLTPAWIRSACWTSARPHFAPRCTRNAQTLKKLVRTNNQSEHLWKHSGFNNSKKSVGKSLNIIGLLSKSQMLYRICSALWTCLCPGMNTFNEENSDLLWSNWRF